MGGHEARGKRMGWEVVDFCEEVRLKVHFTCYHHLLVVVWCAVETSNFLRWLLVSERSFPTLPFGGYHARG